MDASTAFALFVPADGPERFAKACNTGAGAVIIELENAVASAAKVAAHRTPAGSLPLLDGVTLATGEPAAVEQDAHCRNCRHHVDRATRVIKAARVDGTVVVDGAMVDAPVVALAAHILARERKAAT